MAALWLLATQHCGLESAGLLAQGCEQSDGDHHCGATEHVADGCKVVEGAGYKTSNAAVQVPAPQLVASLCLRRVDVLEPAVEQSRETALARHTERPRDWVPQWRFVRRAAAPSRAPSFA
jgi:hypothetical protein